MKIIEIPLYISYEKMEKEKVIFGLTLDECDTENYYNDDKIFYYISLSEFNSICNGESINDIWEVIIDDTEEIK